MPYPLDVNVIGRVVSRPSPGAYLLRRTPDGPVRYVGRSDVDVAERLRCHAREQEYGYFDFEYTPSARSAFEAECALFHRHESTIENAVHPARPPGTDWFCPRCGRF